MVFYKNNKEVTAFPLQARFLKNKYTKAMLSMKTCVYEQTGFVNLFYQLIVVKRRPLKHHHNEFDCQLLEFYIFQNVFQELSKEYFVYLGIG